MSELPPRDRAGVVVLHDGGLAVIDRVRPDGRRYQVIPGGGVEPGETPEQAAVREASEELGLRVELTAHPPLRMRAPRGMHYYFRAVVVGGRLGAGTGPEMTGERAHRGTYTAAILREREVAAASLRPAAVAEVVLRSWLTGAWWDASTVLTDPDLLPPGRQRAGAIVRREGRVLLIRRQIEGAVWFEIPGGGVEPGETPEEAVVRELVEETGLAVTVARHLASVNRVGHPQHYFLVEADGPLASRSELDLEPDASPVWLPLAELADAPVWPKRLGWRVASWSRGDTWPDQPVELSDSIEELEPACFW